jgi:acetyl esterase/lipase
MKRIALIVSISILLVNLVSAQEFIPIWPNGKKANWNGKVVTDSLYNERIWRVGTPGMYAFLVPKSENKGTTVLICPGGGYERLSHIYNGFQFAKWFNAHGINAFVLIYRLPNQTDLNNRQLGPVTDAQRAMKMLHDNAALWGLKQGRIGIMGISAGGHVASTLGTHSDDVSSIKDLLDKQSFLPDFMLLVSPVISMGEYAHPGSRKIFLGADTSKEMVHRYSNQFHVSEKTPSTFMVHAQNDSSVSVHNSLMFYSSLINKNVSASIHIFPQGGHGIKLVDNPGSTDLWLTLLDLWLKEKGFTN